jgi:hypothetical protein
MCPVCKQRPEAAPAAKLCRPCLETAGQTLESLKWIEELAAQEHKG